MKGNHRSWSSLFYYMSVSYKNTMHGMVKIESSVVRT